VADDSNRSALGLVRESGPGADRPHSSHQDGSTPLEDDELEGLIPSHIQTKAELNQWEALNIARGQEWASGQRNLDPLSVTTLKDLHRAMFGETWSWAGTFRRSDKNISPYHWPQVQVLMRELVDNTRASYEASDRNPEGLDALAARFHHQLVRIHPWSNGNGRHARLATDILLERWHQPRFSWGRGGNLASGGTARYRYLGALRSADGGSFTRLLEFVRG